MSKIMREASRAAGKAFDRVAILPERLAQWRSDRSLGAGLRMTTGSLPDSARVALFVIWQPAGLAPSTLRTCRYLVSQGYAPVVISNAALSDSDRTLLAAEAHQVIERPNTGHDFGAWREVLMLRLRSGSLPTKRLLLINDSVWFPLAANDDLLASLDRDAGQHGFTGAAWMERPGRPHSAHFQSYFLMFGEKALVHPAFAAFWRRYPASSRRVSVLARGEKGLSRAMVAARLAGPPSLSPRVLMDVASAASNEELARILDYAALIDSGKSRVRDDLLARRHEADFRSGALALVFETLNAGYFVEAHPYLIAQGPGLHMLKKRREPTSAEGRKQYLRAIAAGHLSPPSPAVLREIQARDR